MVLVVDDDDAVRTVVRWQLDDAGFRVVEADDGASALRRIRDDAPTLVVLDLSLPRLGGLDVLRSVRSGRAGRSDTPIIVLSGRSAETDRITGLDLGADDYLVKPFSPGELAARVRSVLRRSSADLSGEPVTVGGLRIEPGSRRVLRRDHHGSGDHGSDDHGTGETEVELTPKEFDLLLFLATHPRHVFSRSQLLDRVWNSSSDWLGEATVTEHVHRLRLKLEADPAHPSLLRTVRGVGYQLMDGG